MPISVQEVILMRPKIILYIVKKHWYNEECKKGMPISVQEVPLSNQSDQKERRIVACGTRWEENDLAKTGHEGENETEY